MNTRNPSPAAGFTLVELMIVVVILGLLAGMAGLAASDGDQQAIDLATIQVRDGIERAQSLARSSRAAYGVKFDVNGTRFAIIDQAGNVVPDPITKRDYMVDFQLPGQPSLIEFAAADFGATGAAVVFDPQGVPLTGGTVTLIRRSLTGALTIDGATGQVSGP